MATRVHGPETLTDSIGLPLILRLRPALDVSDDQLFELCQLNRELRIERTGQGELLIMPPTGYETGEQNNEVNRQLGNWAKHDGTGTTFDSSTGFRLPNGAIRSPDGGWIQRERLAGIPAEQRKRFLPLCPDFVIEFRSPTDTLRDVQDKMEEYIANGAQLGWLFDPNPRHVYIYRPDNEAERLENPTTIPGDPLLPGFVLDLREVW
ncbi:MAG: Uma2 family endonuclease [Chloroflexi bacterium]|nr:Uma2 family endonuclease [Chloroflexota bacterium]